MEAIVYKGAGKVAVEEADYPEIMDSRDAIIKLTTSAICGNDLHMYEGRTTISPGSILGHEPLGVIEEVGDAVTSFSQQELPSCKILSFLPAIFSRYHRQFLIQHRHSLRHDFSFCG